MMDHCEEQHEWLNDNALYHMEIGYYVEAIYFFEEMLQIRPDDSSVYNDLSKCYRKLGNFDKALYFAHLCIEDKNIGYYNRALIYCELEYYGLAIEDMDQEILADCNLCWAYLYKAEFYILQNKTEKAREIINQLENILKDCVTYESDLYYGLGNCHEFLGDYEKAIDSYSTGIKIDDEDYRCYFYRGQVYIQLEQYEKALQDLIVCYEQNPTDHLNILSLMLIAVKMNEINVANEYYRKILHMCKLGLFPYEEITEALLIWKKSEDRWLKDIPKKDYRLLKTLSKKMNFG